MLGVDEFSGTKLPCLFRERYPVGHPGHLGNRDPSSPCGLPLVADKSKNHSHQRHTKDAKEAPENCFFIYKYIYISYISCVFFSGQFVVHFQLSNPEKNAMPDMNHPSSCWLLDLEVNESWFLGEKFQPDSRRWFLRDPNDLNGRKKRQSKSKTVKNVQKPTKNWMCF